MRANVTDVVKTGAQRCQRRAENECRCGAPCGLQGKRERARAAFQKGEMLHLRPDGEMDLSWMLSCREGMSGRDKSLGKGLEVREGMGHWRNCERVRVQSRRSMPGHGER